MRRPLIGAVMGIAALGALVVPSATVLASGHLYKSNVTPASVGNVASEGPEAYSFNEFGNEVNLTGVKLGKAPGTLATAAQAQAPSSTNPSPSTSTTRRRSVHPCRAA